MGAINNSIRLGLVAPCRVWNFAILRHTRRPDEHADEGCTAPLSSRQWFSQIRSPLFRLVIVFGTRRGVRCACMYSPGLVT